VSPACSFRAERGKARADNAARGQQAVRGSALKRRDPRGAEYRRGTCWRTGS